MQDSSPVYTPAQIRGKTRRHEDDVTCTGCNSNIRSTQKSHTCAPQRETNKCGACQQPGHEYTTCTEIWNFPVVVPVPFDTHMLGGEGPDNDNHSNDHLGNDERKHELEHENIVGHFGDPDINPAVAQFATALLNGLAKQPSILNREFTPPRTTTDQTKLETERRREVIRSNKLTLTESRCPVKLGLYFEALDTNLITKDSDHYHLMTAITSSSTCTTVNNLASKASRLRPVTRLTYQTFVENAFKQCIGKNWRRAFMQSLRKYSLKAKPLTATNLDTLTAAFESMQQSADYTCTLLTTPMPYTDQSLLQHYEDSLPPLAASLLQTHFSTTGEDECDLTGYKTFLTTLCSAEHNNAFNPQPPGSMLPIMYVDNNQQAFQNPSFQNPPFQSPSYQTPPAKRHNNGTFQPPPGPTGRGGREGRGGRGGRGNRYGNNQQYNGNNNNNNPNSNQQWGRRPWNNQQNSNPNSNQQYGNQQWGQHNSNNNNNPNPNQLTNQNNNSAGPDNWQNTARRLFSSQQPQQNNQNQQLLLPPPATQQQQPQQGHQQPQQRQQQAPQGQQQQIQPQSQQLRLPFQPGGQAHQPGRQNFQAGRQGPNPNRIRLPCPRPACNTNGPTFHRLKDCPSYPGCEQCGNKEHLIRHCNKRSN